MSATESLVPSPSSRHGCQVHNTLLCLSADWQWSSVVVVSLQVPLSASMSPVRLHSSNPNLCAELVDFQPPVSRLTDSVECASDYIKLQEEFCTIAQKGRQVGSVHDCSASSLDNLIKQPVCSSYRLLPCYTCLAFIFPEINNLLSKCLVLSVCSPLSAEVGLQHSGHRERKDQTDSVWPGAVRPVGPDQLSQEVSVTGNELCSTITHVASLFLPSVRVSWSELSSLVSLNSNPFCTCHVRGYALTGLSDETHELQLIPSSHTNHYQKRRCVEIRA